MVTCAEMGFKAALMRTESRGWHFREDYPERDDRNWIKWIILKQELGNMVLSTQDVPINKYAIKPQDKVTVINDCIALVLWIWIRRL